ncbi:unnamed protein product, partial [Rotaria sp. Silwood1]
PTHIKPPPDHIHRRTYVRGSIKGRTKELRIGRVKGRAKGRAKGRTKGRTHVRIMAAASKSAGIIILGNSGVGKSFIGNVILGEEAFKHEFRVNAVTTKSEYQECSFNGQTYAVYNIPGLIEADQERIDINKREIGIAFKQHPYAVILYAFGHQNGRIRNEDVVAFNAINDAYPFSQKSLVIIVNGLNSNRPHDYEAETKEALNRLLKMNLPHICFVSHIDSPNEKLALRRQLIQTVATAMPKTHKKEHEINLQAADLAKLTKQIAEFQKQIQEDRERHRLEMIELETECEKRERRQKAEYQKLLRKYEEHRREAAIKEQQQKSEGKERLRKDQQRTEAYLTTQQKLNQELSKQRIAEGEC